MLTARLKAFSKITVTLNKEWRLRPPFFMVFIALIMGASYTHAEAPAKEWAPYSRLLVESYSDSFPIHDIWHGIDDDFQSGKTHFAIGRIEAGFRQGNYALGLISRYEAHVASSRDASTLIWLSETKQRIPSANWQLSLDVNKISMNGIHASYDFSLQPSLKIKLGLQLLQATDMLEGSLTGQLTTYSSDYQGAIFLNNFYTKDSLLDRPTTAKRGQGGALDLQADWRINNNHRLTLTILDLLNGIYWPDMYYTDAKLSSNRISYDANGGLQVAAALSGYEGNKNFWQHLPVKSSLAWEGNLASQNFLLEGVLIKRYQDLRLRWYLPHSLTAKGLYLSASTHQAIGIGYTGKKLNTALQIDNVPSKTHTIMLAFSWNNAWAE